MIENINIIKIFLKLLKQNIINGLGKPLNFYLLEEDKCKNCSYLYKNYTYVTFSIKIIEYKSYMAMFIFGSNY